MVFSSPIFLYAFLPLTLACYFVLPQRARNSLLLAASLVFYAWGEVWYIGVLLASIAVNAAVGPTLSPDRSRFTRRRWLGIGVAGNLLILGSFKYADFGVANLNRVLDLLGAGAIDPPGVHLPLGISFFTFQAISYLVDVYRGVAPAQRNPLRVGLYVALFPQLIAGPIVRYQQVAAALSQRVHSAKLFRNGIQRFVFGLSKKLLIADPMGRIADSIFELPGSELTTGLAWVASLAFTIQIYFDFSGYSDMAIGLGRFFGFRFPENFDYPYVSRSLREFWRRWHISLSSWFRDYVYLPLGGNRRGDVRTALNLGLVFLLCGLWHGASWNFVVWGLYHGGFLAAERVGVERVLGRIAWPLAQLYTLLVVVVGWVIFRCETMAAAWIHLKAMAGFAQGSGRVHYAGQFLEEWQVGTFVFGLALSAPIYPALDRLLRRRLAGGPLGSVGLASYSLSGLSVQVGLAVLCAAMLASNSYSPFLYFRF